MGLFRRKKRPEVETIAEFWQWWSTVRHEVTAAIPSGTVDRFASVFTDHVHAINPSLQWELAAGTSSAHALVVTPGGEPALRAVAARWLAAAPPADETWSYQSMRMADPAIFETTMMINDQKVELSQIRYAIAVNQDSRQIDVKCYHPEFVNLPDDVQGQISFLTLDWAIGEDAVEIWVGEVSWSCAKPAVAKTPQDLRNALAAVASDDSWVIMEGQKRDGAPILAMAASPLRSARWPRFDLHMPITVPYQHVNDGGLPAPQSLDALRVFEDQLSLAIGHNGALVALETSAGVRTLHYYVDSQTNASAELESNLSLWREGRTKTKPQLDPSFEQVGHLMR